MYVPVWGHYRQRWSHTGPVRAFVWEIQCPQNVLRTDGWADGDYFIYSPFSSGRRRIKIYGVLAWEIDRYMWYKTIPARHNIVWKGFICYGQLSPICDTYLMYIWYVIKRISINAYKQLDKHERLLH